MDRLDILVDVPWVDSEKLTAERRGEPSETIQRRVEAARERQAERFVGTNLYCDADIGTSKVYDALTLEILGPWDYFVVSFFRKQYTVIETPSLSSAFQHGQVLQCIVVIRPNFSGFIGILITSERGCRYG